MTTQEIYEQIGMDYDQILERFVDEDRLYKYMNKFVQEPSFARLQKSMEEGNATQAFEAAHALKGICLTLGFGNLYIPVSKLTEQLRTGQMPENDETYQEVVAEYDRVIGMIREI